MSALFNKVLTLEVAMSDGPHKSLPMSKPWKALAERADRTAFAEEEIREALVPALVRDWRQEVQNEVLPVLREVVGVSDQTSLFGDSEIARLGLNGSSSPLARTLVDCVRMALRDGFAGERALQEGAKNALTERALSGARQVEEHYLRETNHSRAVGVRSRLEGAIAIAPIDGLASSLLSGRDSPADLKTTKRTGLDDGVNLS